MKAKSSTPTVDLNNLDNLNVKQLEALSVNIKTKLEEKRKLYATEKIKEFKKEYNELQKQAKKLSNQYKFRLVLPIEFCFKIETENPGYFHEDWETADFSLTAKIEKKNKLLGKPSKECLDYIQEALDKETANICKDGLLALLPPQIQKPIEDHFKQSFKFLDKIDKQDLVVEDLMNNK